MILFDGESIKYLSFGTGLNTEACQAFMYEYLVKSCSAVLTIPAVADIIPATK